MVNAPADVGLLLLLDDELVDLWSLGESVVDGRLDPRRNLSPPAAKLSSTSFLMVVALLLK